jgi:hypothetical protein
MTEAAAPIEDMGQDVRPPVKPPAAAPGRRCAATSRRVAIVDILATERGDGPRPAVLYAGARAARRQRPDLSLFDLPTPGSAREPSRIPRRPDLPGPFPFTLITATRP